MILSIEPAEQRERLE
jgi:hypothetical protein